MGKKERKSARAGSFIVIEFILDIFATGFVPFVSWLTSGLTFGVTRPKT